jgi:enediyne polyketide synthase
LRLEDYYSRDPLAADSIYTTEACLIDNYEFDRVKYRVASSTYRGADHSHWLALDVAAEALADAGFPGGDGLPRETTGVLVGNTLTGEFSRANSLRLRWPYARRVIESMLLELEWTSEARAAFLRECERRYKEPFAPMNEETLAGNLSNTIAGRICNHFDFKGSGYTVDGACASSLLATVTSCSALVAGDLDVAVAGGVDLSIDPFELVGFAKAGALAKGNMLVYDERSSGFLPGEGCGFLVLMRHQDAVQAGRRIYAVIRGWGVSSDGTGGITRPESEGQSLALGRAYERAGFGIDTVAYFEGHGTGTIVGDTTELKALSDARRRAGAPRSAAIGSIKANIGHTKAAAGVAGVIKAVMALHRQIIPPTTGCEQPHREFKNAGASLRVPREGEPWPEGEGRRAAVSAMGFGGINTHVVLEGVGPRRATPLADSERAMLRSARDAELFLFSAVERDTLRQAVKRIASFAGRLSHAELGDLAAHMARAASPDSRGKWRAAVVASNPGELEARLRVVIGQLEQSESPKIDVLNAAFTGCGRAPAIAFLFPGQASPVYVDGGAFARCFSFIREVYSRAELPVASGPSATELAQPAIITASIAALRLLESCGIEAELAIGHSVGEIAALHWAGAFDEAAAIRIASVRGRVMAESRARDGRMVSVRAGKQDVERLLNGTSLVIACINSSEQTVVSGDARQVEEFIRRASREGMVPVLLPVSNAFHSPLVEGATAPFRTHLSSESFRKLSRRVISTVTGNDLSPTLSPTHDLSSLLTEQIVSPVLFADALAHGAADVDLFLEIGPGDVLGRIVTDSIAKPVISVDAGGPSLGSFLKAVGAAYALGTPIDTNPLFGGRFNRPFNLDWNPRFFVNPCELAPLIGDESGMEVPPARVGNISATDSEAGLIGDDSVGGRAEPGDTCENTLELIRGLVAEKTDLPANAIQASLRLLGDLHLNSITVSQIVAEAARRLTLAPPVAPTDYSAVSIADVAAALDDLRLNRTPLARHRTTLSGVDSWVRCFSVDLLEERLSGRRRQASGSSKWRLIAPPDSTLGEALLERLAEVDGEGVAVVLAADGEISNLGLLLDGARAVLSDKNATHFLLVQHKTFGAAFVRTLHLEAPWINCCVVSVPADQPSSVDWIAYELAESAGFTEAVYDSIGTRRVPTLRLLDSTGARGDGELGSGDVVLVSGGGKGIGAECALALSRQTGARLVILGRSLPAADAELAANLDRLASYGVEFRYYSGDVTDRDVVLDVLRQAQQDLGTITGIIHGAGVNTPKLIESLTETECMRIVEPKLGGARNLLEAIDPSRLRLFVTFGSLIARTGMRGEAHYALANELLRDLTERWQLNHPQCRMLCIEWSVWAGPGMGQRLGALDALLQEGISPISLDQGISMMSRLVLDSSVTGSVVVTGRFGEPPTVNIQRPELPFRRFLERTRTYYPGVELIAEAELSLSADPYLGDHVFHGEALFPAVMGLEAMAQTAMALAASDDPPIFEDIEFSRAIVVPMKGTTRIAINALMRRAGTVEVVIRSDDTDYQVDHFRAVCRFESAVSSDDLRTESRDWGAIDPGLRRFIEVDPKKDIYGTLLFHKGRFARVTGYYKITARECIAEVSGVDNATWFGSYLPRGLMLGCPARRDGAIHAIQVCVPSSSLLPVGAARLRIYRRDWPGPCRVIARERESAPDLHVYDVQVIGEDGTVLESWESLKLRRVNPTPPNGIWPLPLLVPYLERMMADGRGGYPVSIALLNGSGDRRSRSESAIRLALNEDGALVRRLDGKPESVDGRGVSASHSSGVTMAVAGSAPVACDIEPVTGRALETWKDLLGAERLRLAEVLSRVSGGDLDVAATGVWAAMECLRKSGAPVHAPLTLCGRNESCAVFSSGSLSIVTVCATIAGRPGRTVLAVLSSLNRARLNDTNLLEYEPAALGMGIV